MGDSSDDFCQISTSTSDEPSETLDTKSTPSDNENGFQVPENREKSQLTTSDTSDDILTSIASASTHSTGESMEIDCSSEPPAINTSFSGIKKAENNSAMQETSVNGDSHDRNEISTLTSVTTDFINDDEEMLNEKKLLKGRKNFRTILDSDSDDETPTPDSESSTRGQKSVDKSSRAVLDSDSEDEAIVRDENTPNEFVGLKKSSKISDLIDSESSEDETHRPVFLPSEEAPSTSRATKGKKEKSTMKRPVTKRAAKDEAMKEIHSETQRLLREAPVSLPYHRPRQRTLQEFLNRTKIPSALPTRPVSQAARLKMSAALMNEVVKAKEKEAELFYKSSDSEDEVVTEPEKVASTASPVSDLVCEGKSPEKVENTTQKFPQHATPRRLFSEDVVDLSAIQSSSETTSESVESAPQPPEGNKHTMNVANASARVVDLTHSSTSSGGDSSSLRSTWPSSNTTVNSLETMVGGFFDSEDKNSSLQRPPAQTELPKKSQNVVIDLTASQSSKSSTSDNLPIPKNLEISPETSGKNSNAVQSSGTNTSFDDDDEPVLDADCRIEGLPPIDLSEMDPKKPEEIFRKKNKIVVANIPTMRPKLQGAPGMMIDLTAPVKTNKTAVNTLLDRFIARHSVAKKSSEVGDVSVVLAEKTAEGVKLVQEKLPYKVPTVDQLDDPMLSKPGAKLLCLKEDLKKKMASKRHEEWKQKEQELAQIEKDFEEDEEEDELERAERKTREIEGSDAESEPEEDDMIIQDKKRRSCTFGDEEAEVSDDMDAGSNDDDENEEDEEELEEQDEDIHLEDESSAESEENSQDKRKKFSRIVTLDDEDSNSREPSPIENQSAVSERPLESVTDDPEIFTDQKNSHELDTDELNSRDSFYSSPSNIMTDSQLSRMCSPNPKVVEPPKKLYIVENRPVTDEEILSLCSGRFSTPGSSTQSDSRPKLTGLVNTECEKEVTDSQLLSLCSGKFPTQSSSISPTDLSANIDDSSQNLKLTLEAEDGQDKPKTFNVLDIKNVLAGDSDKKWTPLDIESSDTENELELETKIPRDVRKKRKAKRLVLSDDEGDDGGEFTDLDEEEEILESDEEKFIDYDSEENEVVVVPKSEIKNVAANFLEHEAELSESEWGSEDEDEKDLDKLEREEGDAEDIDETQMRAQLGKMHVRQVLDDDQRDVRLLKEMLFDDGDLHTDGAGRQRKFKWKNMGNFADDGDVGPRADDDEGSFQHDPADLASEVEWRNLRLQREKFLEEKLKSSVLEDDEEDSQVLKFGMKVISKAKVSAEAEARSQVYKASIPRAVSQLMEGEGKSRIMQQAMQRGSFLARGEEDLARMAALIKQNDSINLGPKHSRNFLFTHISPSVAEDSDENNDVNVENNEKSRKRKPNAGATPRTSKKPKVELSRSSGKKLF